MFRIVLLPMVATLALSAGCQSVPWMRTASMDKVDATADETRLASSREGSSVGTSAVQQASSLNDPQEVIGVSPSAITPISGAALEQDGSVLRELQAIGSVDPSAAQKLLARLQDVKPSLRPLVARQFRTSWEYHRQLTGEPGSSMLASDHHTQPIKQVASLPAEYPTHAADEPPAANTLPTLSAEPPVESAPATPTATAVPLSPAPPVEDPQATNETAVHVDGDVLPVSHEASPKLMPVVNAEPTAGSMEVETPRDWREALKQSINDLASKASDDPRNTDEAYEHVRLRLLQLVAGNRDRALEPIPGLTPTEQTYWSNQLFAIATLPDYEEQPDDQQRASLAADQLEEASAKLGELSSLSLRSLVFCEKVYGYGDYEKLDFDNFQPGQTVTLYAEIENFRSESTEKGYHTSLATSYEVLDQAGNRVEGGEFANVDDYCLNKRQDFYIEYTFQLPSRIYPSKYQLRLLIRDRLSGKIDKATVDFEIKE